MSMEQTQPTDIGEACIILAREYSLDRTDAQRLLGDEMLDALVNGGYARADGRTLTYQLTDAGRRRAAAHRDPHA